MKFNTKNRKNKRMNKEMREKALRDQLIEDMKRKRNKRIIVNSLLGLTIIIVLFFLFKNLTDFKSVPEKLNSGIEKSFVSLLLIPLGILIISGLHSFEAFMKWLFFFIYHITVFVGIYLLISTIIGPYFETDWITGLNWLRKTIIVTSQVTLLGFFTWSILSCFSGKKLTETQMGQWSVSGWMPEWGKNQKNSFYGLFLGLPDWLVKVKAIESISAVITDKKSVQIPIHGDIEGRKFETVIEFNMQYRVDNTFLHIKRPNSEKDLVNLVVRFLTEFLTHGEYMNINDVKKSKKYLLEYVNKGLECSIEMYGDEIINFNIIDIEIPEIQINQQNQDALEKIKQLALDEREVLNITNQNKKIRLLTEGRKKLANELGLTFDQLSKIVEEIQVEEQKAQKRISRYTGKIPKNVIDADL